MSAKKQYGKGLSGFMLGLLLATLVIAGILFFLNQSNKKTFKEQELPQPQPVPEVLTPKDTPMPAFPDNGESAMSEPSEDILGQFIEDEIISEPAAPSRPAEQTGTPAVVAATPEQAKPAVTAEPAKPTVKAEQPKPTKQESKKPVEKKPAEKKTESKPAAKPTPEQILNSGSIEKARKDAQADAAKKAESQPKAATGGSRVVVQMGSFNNQTAAESQRAKLAMMGVSASVVQGTANGSTVYRVQSGRLSQNEAERVRKTLQQNGVDSFSRTVK